VNPGRIAIRALVAFAFALLLVRISGKRTVGQASPFDFTIAIILGDLFDDLLWAEVAASQFFVAMGSIFFAAAIVEVGSARSRRFFLLVNGIPSIVLRNGSADRRALRRDQLSVADLEHLLRQDGIGRDGWGDVGLGVLEHDHHLSVIRRRDAEPVPRKEADSVRAVET
jgi:uncharacterized membrane protein YcaP (DUF421 family)